MKPFLITYTYRLEGSRDDWHRRVAEFIAALDADPELKDRIAYRCMRAKDGARYFHLAQPVDDAAVKTLQQREYFKRYTEETRRVAGGEVEVIGLETIAETK